MIEEKVEKVKNASEEVLNHYINSITRNAFIQFTEDVIDILREN